VKKDRNNQQQSRSNQENAEDPRTTGAPASVANDKLESDVNIPRLERSIIAARRAIQSGEFEIKSESNGGPHPQTVPYHLPNGYDRPMLNAVLLLAQGSPAYAIVELIAIAGIGIVPAAIGAWVLWVKKRRPKSVIVVLGLVMASVAILIWGAAFIARYTKPSVGEEIAVEEVESAFPLLDASTWSYMAKQSSNDAWIIAVNGHTKAGQPINKKFRVSLDTVEEEQSSAPSGWIILKRWGMPNGPASQPTSAP
jgi:hypothetical protein